MRDAPNRRAVLGILSGRRDPAWLRVVGVEARPEEFLRWLDHSGLALYFARYLATHRQMDSVAIPLRLELERRMHANRARTGDMLREFARVNAALQGGGVEYAVLKGFSLTPEFCEESWLRHQTDIDLLVASKSIAKARESLLSIEYVVEGEEPTGEVRFGMNPKKSVSAHDFLYDSPQHRQVEIHSNFHENVNGVSLRVDESWNTHVEFKQIGDTRFPVLDYPYRVLGQLLHAFRHILHGWLRVGWLYEISRVLQASSSDNVLWEKVDGLLLGESRAREACGVVVAMTNLAFGVAIPEFVERTWVRSLRRPLRIWVDNLGLDWMLSDFPGSRLSLLLHREFADSAWVWQKFRLSRSQNRIRAISRAKLANPLFLLRRIREDMEYFWHYLDWNIQVLRHPSEREGSVTHSSR